MNYGKKTSQNFEKKNAKQFIVSKLLLLLNNNCMLTHSVCSSNNISNEISVIQSMCYITHILFYFIMVIVIIWNFSFRRVVSLVLYCCALPLCYIARINTRSEWESEKKREKETYRRFHWDIKIIIPIRISCSSNSINSSQCSNMLDVMIKFSEIRAWCV